MHRIVSLLAYSLICATVSAQQYPFVHYTPREGLVNNRARFIFQDSKGKLYVSTFGGLSIYDGTRFTNYTQTNGLASSMINDVVEMGEDSVWIVPNSHKIHCLVNGRLKDFVPGDNFIPLINQLIKCSDGYYYAMADEGLFRWQNNRFIKIPVSNLPNGGVIKTLVQGAEANNKLYLLSNPDYKLATPILLVYDLSKNKLIAFNENIQPVRLFTYKSKELWVASMKGVFTPDAINEQTKIISLKPLHFSKQIPNELPVYFICADRQNNTWLSTSNGIYRVNKLGEASLFTSENGLTTNFHNSILQDHENNIWFTNELTGLCKLANQQFAYYPVFRKNFSATDIFIDPAGDSVWMHDSYHHKVLLIGPVGKIREYENPHELLPYLAKFISGKSQWLLTGNSIFQWKAAEGTSKYSLSLLHKDTMNEIGFNCGELDNAGNLVTVSDKVVVVTGTGLLSKPVGYMADQLAIDKNNRVWVATRSNQLFCFSISGTGSNTNLSAFKSFTSVVKSSPRSITADKDGNIWIGTREGGLFYFHFDGSAIKLKRQLTTQNGLSENFISYLYCDNENNIWACTPSGLDKIKMTNGNFVVENLTKSNNLYFPVIKIQQGRSGMYWILSSSGIITYKPGRNEINNWKPRLSFSETLVNNSDKVTLLKGRTLKYFQNNLVFHLSAPSFIDEKQTRFSYLLEGSGNENWSFPSQDASVNLVNLPPGNYILKARAIFLHGLYPDAESSFPFTILPPWWQTWWFRSAVVVSIIALLVGTLRFYYRRKLERQKLAMEKQKAIEKERTRIATDMHDDLGAGLSRIKFLSEAIGMKKQQHLPIEEEITSIRTYSHEMIDKMGEIVWALNEKNDTLSDLLSYTRAYAVEYLQENGLACTVTEPEDIPERIVSGEFRRNIYLTVKETLHNIVKHAEATRVLIVIDITERLNIWISDNGKGMNDTTVASGNGLINMKKRIKSLNGNFTIDGHNGTKVGIEAPLNT